jgi:hypothetical protein
VSTATKTVPGVSNAVSCDCPHDKPGEPSHHKRCETFVSRDEQTRITRGHMFLHSHRTPALTDLNQTQQRVLGASIPVTGSGETELPLC